MRPHEVVTDIDTLEAEAFGPLGHRLLCLIDLSSNEAIREAMSLATRTQAIVVGLDRPGVLPSIDPMPFDLLLSTAERAPAPWVYVPPARWDERLRGVGEGVAAAPIAASIATRTLRMADGMRFEDAMHLESLGYSTLLAGDAFQRWRAGRPLSNPVAPRAAGDAVTMLREGDDVIIRLDRPDTRNAMTAVMRDALHGALAATLDDPTRPTVRVEGAGACFSTGGDLDEFGSADDLAQAHAIRCARSCAILLNRLDARATAILHGACIGSGVEIAAAATRRIGRPDAFFQLPELGLGLMPGAGGTASLPRAIGRHRTAYMLLSGRRIDARTALDWGLLSAIEPER